MMPAIKSEFRKLLTTRTTYFICGFALLINAFFSFWVEGFKAAATSLHNPLKLASEATSAVSAVSIFAALIAILLFANEYRYNTIMYTLTSTNSRSKVLVSKIFVVSVFALLFTVVMGVFSPLATSLGIHVKGAVLAPQTIPYWDVAWRALFFGWAYGMIGLLFVGLMRNQVAAIVGLFVVPSTVETLLGLLLKDKVVYLPFSALSAVLQHPERGMISYGHAALVGLAYLVFGWLVAWVLFLRRDAN
ncbi:MAG TPA: ABC transporter permease [Candidatus Saccharimonadales bacterium]|nr:ABC transporter permease [Candidatus Saccharimonadales bacterium]